ncbi:hypothetical protein RB653_001614 [Dictyostelium firmibasis]|uniref:Serine/threonine-protein phosphatase n=1 Tax=Dictyostelium firmibasis TaxID=79012 RepID=A0AAN7U4D1_9MYCE
MNTSTFNLDHCIEKLQKCEILPESTVKEITDKMKELLISESNVQEIRSPVTVVGDVHGQFYDVLEIFKIGGQCPDTNYLFLGDYVDRGYHSVETISLLTCLKLRYPSRITLLRGNHESRQITQVYGFYGECMRKYGNPTVWKYFTEMFDYLSVAAIIDEAIYCVHGGLSPSALSIDQIKVLDRFQEVPNEGALSDILWSDPDPDRDGFVESQRGAGYSYGKDVTLRFLQNNKMQHIIRAHQLCMDGYQTLFDNKLSTVWSAPNYCNRCGNMASIVEVNEKLERYFNTYAAAPQSLSNKPTLDTNKELPDYFL